MTKPRNPFPLNEVNAFRAWKWRHPNAEKLLFRIIFRWRVSTAHHSELPGKCVANPIDFWAEDAKLSRDQTKRALTVLEHDGLVLRARGWFRGSKVHPYLQPTPLALKFMGKSNDIDRLAQSIATSNKSKPAPTPAPIAALTPAPTIAPIAAPTITTLSIPSTLSNPAKLSIPHAQAHTGGEGKAGEDGKIKKKKLVLKKQNPKALAPNDDDVDVEAVGAAITAKKRARLLKQFPPLHGAHEKFVKHPSAHWGDVWFSRSQTWQAASYAWYVQMVERWYTGEKGKAYKALSYEDAEFNLDLGPMPTEAEWKAMSKDDADKWDEMSEDEQIAVLKSLRAKLGT